MEVVMEPVKPMAGMVTATIQRVVDALGLASS